MRKILSIWLHLSILSLVVMYAMYWFGNDAEAAVSKYTMKNVVVISSMTGTTRDEFKRIERALDAAGVKTSEHLQRALARNPYVSNISINQVGDTKKTGRYFLKQINLSFSIEDNIEVELPFLVAEKQYLNFDFETNEDRFGPLSAKVLGFDHLILRSAGHSQRIELDPDLHSGSASMVAFMGSIFHRNDNELRDIVQSYLSSSF